MPDHGYVMVWAPGEPVPLWRIPITRISFQDSHVVAWTQWDPGEAPVTSIAGGNYAYEVFGQDGTKIWSANIEIGEVKISSTDEVEMRFTVDADAVRQIIALASEKRRIQQTGQFFG